MRSWDLAVRGGLAALAALNLWWGAWARIAPRHFFDNFPGLGRSWTAAYPPYNEHLTTDLGSTFLTLAFLLAVAAVVNDRKVRLLVLAGVLLFNALHLGFHATDAGTMGSLDYAASIVALAAGVALPAVLLVIEAVRRRPTS